MACAPPRPHAGEGHYEQIDRTIAKLLNAKS